VRSSLSDGNLQRSPTFPEDPERWSVDRYQLPQLDVQSIRRLDDTLQVDSRRGVCKLTCDDAASFDRELLPMLDALRDPASAVWSAVRDQAESTAELIPMLRELDHLGLIRECGPVDASRAHAAIERAVRSWSAQLGRELAAGPEQAVAAVDQLADELSEPRAGQGAVLGEHSFFAMTLVLQARSLRAGAPAVLALLVAGLRAAVRRVRLGETGAWWCGVGEMPASADEDWSCGLIDLRVVRRNLAAAGHLVRDAVSPGAARRVRSHRAPVDPLSGINFMLDLEAELARILAGLGPSPAFTALEDPALARRVIRSAFLQEYLVTCRFAECLAPLLSRRFAEPLRDAVHRYFAEETGHEAFERDYCVRLGFTEQELDRAEPLPLHLAFVDILSALAGESPIAVFCASMFTRGAISTRNVLASLTRRALPDEPLLVEAIGDHLAADGGADHGGVGRDWMSRVPLVTPRIQREVGDLVAYLAELNWRMWDQLVRSCAAGPAGAPHS